MLYEAAGGATANDSEADNPAYRELARRPADSELPRKIPDVLPLFVREIGEAPWRLEARPCVRRLSRVTGFGNEIGASSQIPTARLVPS